MNISLIIPSRNNLKYVKFAYSSIRKHLPIDVELILLDDYSSDNTWEWMSELSKTDKFIKIYRHGGPDRIGHTYLYDIGAEMASNDVIGIFHADMIATPNYINNMIKHIKPGVVVSGTRIEPPLHPPGPEKYVKDFGIEPEEFDETSFLKFVNEKENFHKDKTTTGIFAPWIIYKKDLLSIGGHDKKLFAPMELEDSDLFNRFLLTGYTLIQSRDAFVYHMTCRGSRFKDGIKITNEIPIGNGEVWKRAQDSNEYLQLRQIKFREWWRKWHTDVLHDENMLPIVYKRYNVGFIINNINEQILNMFEPWADTLYINNSEISKNYIENEQKISNFNIKDRIKNLTDDKTNDVLIEFDARHLNNNSQIEFIKNLSKIIETSGEVGSFEYDIFQVTIKSMDSHELSLINNEDFYKKYNL